MSRAFYRLDNFSVVNEFNENMKKKLLLETYQRPTCQIRDLDIPHWRPTCQIEGLDMPHWRRTFPIGDRHACGDPLANNTPAESRHVGFRWVSDVVC